MLLSVSTWAESSITAEDLPPWLKPELLVHIADMNMNKDQNIGFMAENAIRDNYKFNYSIAKKDYYDCGTFSSYKSLIIG